jgi:hypothetical protein
VAFLDRGQGTLKFCLGFLLGALETVGFGYQFLY